MKNRALFVGAVLLAFLCGAPFLSYAAGLSSIIDLGAASENGVLSISGNYSDGVMGLTCSTGDINGDGLDDAVFGALRNDPKSQSNAGMVYVVFGSSSLKTAPDIDMASPPTGVLRIFDTVAEDQFGRSVAVNDLNGDGYGDIIASAWHASPEERPIAGTVYVIFGSPSLSSEETINLTIPRPDIITIYAQNAGEELGTLLFSGDVNGDGFADAIIGAYNADSKGLADNGKTYVVFGSADMKTRGTIDTRDSTRVLVIHGAGNGDQLGYHVTSGDLNNDGYDEVITGARLADVDSLQNAGKAYVIWGSADMASRGEINLADSSCGALLIDGANTWDLLSDRMNTGDVDGDGFDDLFIGASGYDVNTGAIYILFGSTNIADRDTIDLGSDTENIAKIIGEHTRSFLHMPFPGDMNGDGIDDVIVAAHSTYREEYGSVPYGAVYVIFGSGDVRSNPTIDLSDEGTVPVKIIGGVPNAYLGISAFTGDFDGDGCADIVLGASNADPNGITNAGEVYLIWGSQFVECPFAFKTSTGDSATIVIKKENAPLIDNITISPGDIIGVFTPFGICAGAGIWTGEDFSITIWGDDPQCEYLVGFRENEELSFKVWVKSTGTIYSAELADDSTGIVYQSDATIVLGSLMADKNTGIEDNTAPEAFSLSPNYPNPFNPSTTISFTLPQSGRVTVTIYNVLGAKITTLADNTFSAGTHNVAWNAETCGAGTYFCRVQMGSRAETIKMTLLK